MKQVLYMYIDGKIRRVNPFKKSKYITINFVATRLAEIKRCSGTSEKTILDHSMDVAFMAAKFTHDEKTLKGALLHDITEIYYGDIPSGLKTPSLRKQENKLLRAMLKNIFDLDYNDVNWKIVKKADKLAWEKELKG